ncbi:MAG: hypothetical protein FWD05_00105 [Oscillospiraceae bacterium]|nr:hypothetical protein [Oscillospiraceae bacterium]
MPDGKYYEKMSAVLLVLSINIQLTLYSEYAYISIDISTKSPYLVIINRIVTIYRKY